MKKIILSLSILMLVGQACNSSKNGLTEIKTPFKGSSYESNRRFFRAVASGESINLETAKSKAMLTANQRMASSVQTEIKNVTENYQNERNADGNLGDFGERFQQLTREVMATTLIGSNLINEKTFQKTDKTYQVWVAMELRKREMYKQLKQLAKEKNTLSDKEKKAIEKMLDKKIEELDDKD